MQLNPNIYASSMIDSTKKGNCTDIITKVFLADGESPRRSKQPSQARMEFGSELSSMMMSNSSPRAVAARKALIL